jgi:cystathionine beta-lyase
MKWNPKRFLSEQECAADPLPMWVADMDFRAPQPVLDALSEAINHGVFGYSGDASESYLDAVVDWQGRRFGWEVPKQWLIQTSGVITTIKTAIQAFSAPGDSVLIQPPVYVHFHDDTRLNGRHVTHAPLELVGNRYHFDARTFEQAIRKDTKLFILSNPHNPTGNVWTSDELRTMGEICARHGIIVIADEIHQDFILNPTKRHTPFASLGGVCEQISIVCTAPSKTFNLPGLQTANIIVPNPRLRNELARQYDRNVYSRVNYLGMVAAQAAYTHGEAWLEELLTYVRANQAHFAHEINAMSGIKVLPTDALYLAWMDCRGLGMEPQALNDFMLLDAKVWLDRGDKFGVEGNGFMRANLGCSRTTVDEAIHRIKAGLATSR